MVCVTEAKMKSRRCPNKAETAIRSLKTVRLNNEDLSEQKQLRMRETGVNSGQIHNRQTNCWGSCCKK